MIPLINLKKIHEIIMERLDYRTGGLDFHPPSSMLLENPSNYSHLQKSIDTLRSLGDRLGNDRNADLKLNLHQDLRNYDRNLANDRTQWNIDRNLELNLSLNSDRYFQERLLNEKHESRNIDRGLIEHSLSIERINLERSLAHHMTERTAGGGASGGGEKNNK